MFIYKVIGDALGRCGENNTRWLSALDLTLHAWLQLCFNFSLALSYVVVMNFVSMLLVEKIFSMIRFSVGKAEAGNTRSPPLSDINDIFLLSPPMTSTLVPQVFSRGQLSSLIKIKEIGKPFNLNHIPYLK